MITLNDSKSCDTCGKLFNTCELKKAEYIVMNTMYCRECGIEKVKDIIKERSDELILLTVEELGVKSVDSFKTVNDMKKHYNIPKNYKMEINLEYGNPAVWFVTGKSGTKQRRVQRVGTLINGIDKCKKYIRHVDLSKLTPDVEDIQESKHLKITPMRDVSGYIVVYKVTIKDSGKEMYATLTDLINCVNK